MVIEIPIKFDSRKIDMFLFRIAKMIFLLFWLIAMFFSGYFFFKGFHESIAIFSVFLLTFIEEIIKHFKGEESLFFWRKK